MYLLPCHYVQITTSNYHVQEVLDINHDYYFDAK